MSTNMINNQTQATLATSKDWTSWFTQLQSKADASDIWDMIDPDGFKKFMERPTAPLKPQVSDSEPALPAIPTIETASSNTMSTRSRTQQSVQATSTNDEAIDRIPPRFLSDLSTSGLKAYKDDLENWKMEMEAYKEERREWEREQASRKDLVKHIQSTVSKHLQKTCCRFGTQLREQIRLLRTTVGIEDDVERDKARDRYLVALRPMRYATSWEGWLVEYDEAATEAEAEGVSETLRIHDVVKDFLAAVQKVAPIWTSQFRRELQNPRMSRRQMMKEFKMYMEAENPVKNKSHRGAFFTGDTSPAPSEHGVPIQGSRQDAVYAADTPHQGEEGEDPETMVKKGKTLKPKSLGKIRRYQGHRVGEERQSLEAIPKQLKHGRHGVPVAAGGRCPACDQPHSLKDCFYAFPEKAPEGFNPRPWTAKMVQLALSSDADLQGMVRGLRNARSFKTPRLREEQTPKPEAWKE